VLALLSLAAQAPPAQAQGPGVTLAEGDIIVLDILDDAVYHLDPSSGTVTTIASGSLVLSPRGVAVSPEGLLYVSDTALDWMLRIDPVTGEAIPFFSFSSPTIPEPGAMLLAENGDLLVIEASKRQILRVDPATAVSSVEFQLDENTWFPIGLARDPDGKLIAVDRLANPNLEPPTLAGIWRVDVAARTQSEVLTSTTFKSLRTVAVQSDGKILVADRGQSGDGAAVYRVSADGGDPGDPETFDDSFTGPNGVAVDDHDPLDPTTYDTVLVTDYSDGELVRLDPDGGNPDVLSSSFNGPYVVAVVPELSPRDHDEFLISDAGADDVCHADATNNTCPSILIDPIAEPRAMAFADPIADPSHTPQDGVIFVIDGPDEILRVDIQGGVQNGEQTVVASGENLTDLSDIAVEWNGQIVVADRDGEVIRVDPSVAPPGNQTVLTNALGEPTSLVVDGNGSIIVTDRNPVADDTPDDDSGLFRVSPLNGSVQQFAVANLENPAVFLEFIDPKALARDFNGDLLLIAGDDATVPSQIYRVFGADGPGSLFFGVAFSTDLDGALADAVAMVVDANRDPIVAFEVAEPRRVDPLTGVSTPIPVGGDFGDATDLVYEGMPEPGEPADGDNDLVPDWIDNCPDVANPEQNDANLDGIGDVCQPFDFDLDGIPDFQDNCFDFPNPPADICSAGLVGLSCTTNADCDDGLISGVCSFMQADVDADGVGDVCDNCPDDANSDQSDGDGVGGGDACDDRDGDGLLDISDNCPNDANPGQEDVGDADGVGDECDNCPDDDNPDQSDLNDDGVGDVCQDALAGPDTDGDGWPDDEDNCPDDANPDQSDLNDDGFGDVCQDALAGPDSDGDGIPDDGGDAPCAHLETVDCDDNCPDVANPDQSDVDGDGEGAACETNDADLDGADDDFDNCLDVFNPDQSDVNNDGVGDVCQDALAGPDSDGDGIPDDGDDSGAAGDAPCAHLETLACDDNCPDDANSDQSDLSGDDVGDVCQYALAGPDTDGDGIPDDGGDAPCAHLETVDCDDNCRFYPNTDQADGDADRIGDVCDPTPVPEPGAMARLFAGLALLRALVWHRRRGAATA
jgi:streptogramin lyase